MEHEILAFSAEIKLLKFNYQIHFKRNNKQVVDLPNYEFVQLRIPESLLSNISHRHLVTKAFKHLLNNIH